MMFILMIMGLIHVKTVIRRATDLVNSVDCLLTPREVYFLLMAIQFHDVGNIFGRYKHELKSGEIIKQLSVMFSSDSAEQKIIWDIAKSHGGRDKNFGKDTISALRPSKYFINNKIRTQLLAAILRFADELADDCTRAAKWPLSNGVVPKASVIFHKYSEALNSVIVNHETHSIELHFCVQKKDLDKTFSKYENKVFVIDEIFQRIVKMHLERLYCMRFMRRDIYLDKIEVFIEFISSDFIDSLNLPKIEFTIQESGYPEYTINGIYDLCPTLLDDGVPMDGMYFFNKLKNSH